MRTLTSITYERQGAILSQPAMEYMQHTDVLVVDDDPFVRAMLSAFLEQEGYRVQTAANGAEALDCVLQEQPTLVLLDMNMPIMDGWDFVRELKSREFQIPIIVMTPARDARECAQEVGATAYVSKPVSLPALISHIDQICA